MMTKPGSEPERPAQADENARLRRLANMIADARDEADALGLTMVGIKLDEAMNALDATGAG